VLLCRESVARAKRRTVGDPFDPKTEQGPQIDADQLHTVLSYIESGKREGAKLLAGGERVGSRGHFVQPTVFADVQDDMKIAKEEIFGPVMAILKFKTLDGVVQRANQTTYGLAAGIWTRDIGKAHAIAKGVRAGTVFVNCYDVFVMTCSTPRRASEATSNPASGERKASMVSKRTPK